MNWIKSMIEKKLFILITLGLLSFVVLSLKFFSLPWVYVFLSLSVYLYLIYRHIHWTNAKVILVNICVFFALLTPVEFLTYHLTKTISQSGKRSEFKDVAGNRPFVMSDRNLGYLPNPSTVFKHSEYYADGTQNSVHYSINENSLRISIPEHRNDRYVNSVLFFGCSFTFGEMVEDNETLPWRFAELDDYRRNVYNFGFEGWGPHHMLASLQDGRVEKIVSEEPNLIVFQGILDHLNRVTNDHIWINNGPKYVLKGDQLVRAGNFSKNSKLLKQLNKSSIYSLIMNSVYLQPSFKEKALLFTEIIKTSRDISLGKYDSAQFIVVMWPDPRYSGSQYKLILDLLVSKGIEVVEVTNILTDIKYSPELYFVTNNGHPNPLAFNEIASFLLQKE